MKQSILLCSLLCCFITSLLNGQVQTIAYQGFEQNASDTWAITLSTSACNRGGDIWDYVTSLGSINPSVGTSFWGIQDLTGNCGSSSGETISFATTSVTGFNNVSISFDYNIYRFDAGDDVFYTLILDGVAQTQVQLVDGNGNFSTGGYVTETISIPNGTSTVGLEFLVDQNGAADQAGFDNFILQGDLVAACPQTVTRFAPKQGPAGTEVRIIGTGFTNTSTVTFDGVMASNVQFVSATELIATAPATFSTGNLIVTENSCPITAGTFTLVEGNSSCATSTSVNGLIISEVYDNNGGSLGYIELFNGTSSTIDLTLYRIDRYGDLTTTSSTHSYSFPTTGTGSSIAPGQVLVGKVSTSSGSAGDFNFTGTTAGFNDNDRLELVLDATNTIVDDFHDAIVGNKGFVYRRNTTITGANPSFNSSEWTIVTMGDISDLGTYITVTPGTPPSIASQPTDVSGCAIDLTMAATASNGGTITYQWYFHPNDATTIGWTAVSSSNFPSTTLVGATAAHLQISGNLTAYDNYQFYCEATESGACSIVSDAVQYDLAAERFFRSKNTGDWTDANTWELASSATGPWQAACIYPTATNSDYVHIMLGHQVNVDADITIDQLVIETGATVSIQHNRLLEIANATGTDLQINGTLIDNGNGGSNGINFSTNSSTWLYGANGILVKTGSSSVIEYRDSYEGGISSVPNTAHWHYRYTGSSATVAVSAVGMYYPNLYFESTNGDYQFNGGTEALRGSSNYATVKGNFSVGATGTGAVEITNTNRNSTLMQVLGDLIIGGNAATGTSILKDDRNGVIGTGIEVFGNVTIHTNGRLDFSDGTSTIDGTLRLHGNWTSNNPSNDFKDGQSTVAFVGTTNQTINKVAGNESFYNIIVDKPSGFLVNNVNDLIIENNVLFVRGIVLTASAKYMVFDVDATATGASDVSHVDGPVIKRTSSSNSTTFTYPTGNSNVYGPIGIETRYALGEPFIARYHYNGYGMYNYNPMELDHVSHIEYWDLDEVNANAGENVRVTLHWGAHSNVLTPSSLRVAHFFTQGARTTPQWEREGNSPIITGNATRGSIASDWVTSFSPFTIADMTIQTSLPLDLLSFDVKKREQKADIFWEVANEFAGDVYCLERSNDGIHFENIACFEATENRNTASYQYTDEQPLFGYNYYRIHQVDQEGLSNYSPTRVVEFGTTNKVKIYPNPAKNTVQLELPILGIDYTIRIVDALGRTLLTTTKKGIDNRQQLDVSSLTAGTYIMQVETTTGVVGNQKITIVR